jgi:acyl carrier protein
MNMCNYRNEASRERIFAAVRSELLRVCSEQNPDFDADIRLDSSLVADLGLDSLSLVEVVVGLEQALQIEHLPLDALRDRASRHGGESFTVESLVNLCMEQAVAA